MSTKSYLRKVAAIFASVALLSACSNSSDESTQPEAASQQETAAVASSTQAEATEEPEESCGELTRREAFDQNVDQVPKYNSDFGWEYLDGIEGDTSYDPCADLSVILTLVEGGNSNSAFQALFFHKDQFVGHAGDLLGRPVATRLADDTIEIRTHSKNGFYAPIVLEDIFIYKWDKKTKSLVVTEGEDTDSESQNSSSGVVPYSTGIPESAKPMSVVKHDNFYGDFHIIQTPSTNIGCLVTDSDLACTVKQLNLDAKTNYSGPLNRHNSIGIHDGVADTGHQGGVPAWVPGAAGSPHNDPEPEIVPYGTAVTNGRFVCLSEEKGLTCWDSQTGAGGFLAREEVSVHN